MRSVIEGVRALQSRVVPEVTQTQAGELVVLRSARGSVPPEGGDAGSAAAVDARRLAQPQGTQSVLAVVMRDDALSPDLLHSAARLAGNAPFDLICLFPAPAPEYVVSISSPSERTAQDRDATRRKIEADLKALSLTANVRVPVATLYNLGDEIVERARQVDARVIVIGTQRRRSLSQLLLGSVADRVVRRAHCDVYVVRAPSPE